MVKEGGREGIGGERGRRGGGREGGREGREAGGGKEGGRGEGGHSGNIIDTYSFHHMLIHHLINVAVSLGSQAFSVARNCERSARGKAWEPRLRCSRSVNKTINVNT